MDPYAPLPQNFNGGIIFLSYLISVIGAQTTLELFTRRTHFRGLYNWFLLTLAAFVMGGVSIWSMHFIGNQSLTITIPGNQKYQLSYAVGYTISSLVVVIATMFISFAFIGTTEEAKISRIIPSGIFAGGGIATMHYLGQFAIQYFTIVYKPGYVVGAIIIACIAITVALYIFFKLREQWANQWYMRFGCSLMMALAVCGMHYTGLAGTDYYLPSLSEELPPTPSISTGALIGIIAAVVVIGCLFLFYVVFKGAINTLPSTQKNKTTARLVLGIVLFDSADKILVKIDGVVPTKEVSDSFDLGEITTKHPLFVRLFQVATRWANRGMDSERPSVQSSAGTVGAFDVTERQFCEAARDLQEELKLPLLADLGLLFDTVVHTNTIVTKPGLFKYKRDTPTFKPYSANNWLLWRPQPFSKSKSNSPKDEEEMVEYPKTNHPGHEWGHRPTNSRTGSQISFDELCTKDKIKNRYSDPKTSDSRSTVQQTSEPNDQYIFLVKKLVRTKDLQKLLAQGYRFADPIYISRTMATQLHVPVEHMLFYLKDMKLMADSLSSLVRHKFSTTGPSDVLTIGPSAEESQAVEHLFGKETTKSGVYVGLFVLLDEDNTMQDTHILIDKARRFAFPMVQLKHSNGETPLHLTLEEKICLNGLGGKSLLNIAGLETQKTSQDGDKANGSDTLYSPPESPTQSNSSLEDGLYNINRFKKALEGAAKKLASISRYSRPLGLSAKLHHEIIDTPPFSLMVGPCQVILFKVHITTPGIISAINQTFSEPIKCVPLSIFHSMAIRTTDQAVDLYRQNHHINLPETSYLDQQRMYVSSASSSRPEKDVHSNQLNIKSEDIPLEERKSTTVIMVNTAPAEHSDTLSSFSPLPPPPRAKKPRFTLPKFEFESSKERRSGVPCLRDIAAKPDSPPLMLNLLPSQDRYWWLNSIIEDTLHDD
ncbi:hypothetical protein CLU79DRAFT_773382 [Phycomyces nitens]|nr:hypothetical protein CLU79DRAFT_773382 [Phycomyces nitens]